MVRRCVNLGWFTLLLTCGAEVRSPSELAALVHAVKELSVACEHDGGKLWNTRLCGALILVDPATRWTVLTQPDPERKFERREGFYLGTLPEFLGLSNTSVHWGDRDWTMVMLPLPENRFERLALLAHESFHRVQRSWEFSGRELENDHLDTRAGRLWLRLELRALARALRTSGAAARQSAADAVLFRAYRDSLFTNAAERESSLEMNEGLAAYTGTVIALRETGEMVDRVARQVDSFEDRTSFVRSFAYATGPALGLLLDRYNEGWRRTILRTGSLSAMLATTGGLPAADKWASEAPDRAADYGYRAVAGEEDERETRRQERLAYFQKLFIDGPVLQFPKAPEMQRIFNPSNLVPFPPHGTVYPTGSFMANWGKLQIEDVGALFSQEKESVRVVAPANIEARPLRGPGWQLELAPGWTIRLGSRSGDYVVVAVPAQ